jgi:hypothetical protein
LTFSIGLPKRDFVILKLIFAVAEPMKYILHKVFILGMLVFSLGASAETMELEGIYQGKDLYVKNPFTDDGVGFCVYEVYVNGDLTRDEVNSSAFAVDFNIIGIEIGSPVKVTIKHKAGCAPLVLNPESIMPHSTFEIGEISVENNMLSWKATKESGALPYIVEQFRWNKWVKVGEVMGSGTKEAEAYEFKLTPYSGENRVRVKQVDYTGEPRYSDEVTYESSKSPVSFSPRKPETQITFSAVTRYEVFDKYGKLVKTGFDKSASVSDLKSGEKYYLNYDNSFGDTFVKK